MSQMPTLFVDQQNAFEKLQKFKVGALFMEPGTGKTLTAYELLNSVKCINYILWLTPFQTKVNLRNEIEKWGDFACDFDIIAIETLSSSDRVYLEIRNKLQTSKAFIICDESLKIKNFEAKRTKRIIELGQMAEYKLILNGTPLSRNVLDLWAQLEFLSPKILNMPIAQYKNTFVKYTTITKQIGCYKIKKEIINGYENIDYLYSLIHHYVYECDLKIDIKKEYWDRSYYLSDEIQEEYKTIKEEMLEMENMIFHNNNIFIMMVTKMQHAYCCTENKFEVASRIVENPEKTIFFCKFKKSEEAVQTYFPKTKVLTYGKHSYGLNMQDYNTCIFFDKTFDYAQRLQAERRIYRTGQTDNCKYYDLSGNVGLENLIDKNISRKEDMLNYFKQISFETFMKQL